MKRILIVGSQHGDELLGEQLYAVICLQPKVANLLIEYVLANPRAHQRGVRLVESDMNRSYKQGSHTYEQRRAQQLLRRLRGHDYDIVIDAHTTTVDQPPCVIVPDITDDNYTFLTSLDVKNVVVMRHPFVRQSLIGNVPRCVSLEISIHQLGDGTYRSLYAALLNFSNSGKQFHPDKDVFVVDDLLARAELPAQDIAALRNFELAPQGFYPVLVGEAAYQKYTEYLGFKAVSKLHVNLLKYTMNGISYNGKQYE